MPRDPQHPDVGGTIGLALDRRPAKGRPVGSLLVDPGGPGASGVDFLPYATSMMPGSLLSKFDVVGFDPPGVGRSAPVVCEDSTQLLGFLNLDPVPATADGLAALLDADRAFAAGCQARSGAELPYVSTVDAAIDMDYIRRAVGDARLSYLGFSYGTFLGATYADLFPDRIRAMVLDGASDPSLPPLASLDQQSAAIEGDLNSFFASCQANRACPWKTGPDPLATFQALLARVRAHPVAVPQSAATVGPAALLLGTAAALYATATWPTLEQGLAQLEAGNGTTILELFYSYIGLQADGTLSNLIEAESAVNCIDTPAPSVAAVQADVANAESVAPVLGVVNLYGELLCSVWPVPAAGRPAPIHAVGSPPIVVVGTTGDPATPYPGAQAMARQLDHGVLLTRVGEGHTAYPYSGCIRGYVDAYLTDLRVPAPGTRCPH